MSLTNTESITTTAQEPQFLKNLAHAVNLHLRGDSRNALQVLEKTQEDETSAPELHAARGRLQAELNAFREAAESFTKLVRLQPENASAKYHLALCLQHQGLWGQAVDLFRQTIRSEKYRVNSLLGLGLSQLHLKQAKEALESLESCLGSAPDLEPALIGKAVALQLQWEFESASRLYERVLGKNPDSRECLINMIALAGQRKDFTSAKTYAQRLIALEPDSEAGWEGLAAAAFGQEDYPEAVRASKKLTEIQPLRYENWYNLGVAWHGQKDSVRAEEAYLRALEIQPDGIQAQINLGVLYRDAGQLEPSRETLQSVLLKAPDREDVRFQVALLVEQEGSLSQAETLYGELVAKNPSHENGWFRLGYLQLQQGNYAGALEAFRSCIQLRQPWPEAELNLAMAAWHIGNLDMAEETLQRMLIRDANNVAAVRGMAAVALSRQDLENALKFHDRLVVLGEESAEIFFNKALLAQKMGEDADAIKHYEASLGINPDLTDALINLGHLLRGAGREEEAHTCWQKALDQKPELARGYFLQS